MNRFHLRALVATTLSIASLFAVAAPPKASAWPPENVELKPSKLPGYAVAQQKCAICHSADYIAYQPPGMTLTQWTAEMTKMQRLYGAPIDDQEIKLLGVYFAATYGNAASVGDAERALAIVPVAAPASNDANRR